MALIQKAFSDIITFSRSSNATRVGPTGVLEYAPHNLILQSQTFDNASWTKGNSSVSANAAAAPDGTVTADKLVENTASSTHQCYQATTLTAQVHTLSFYAKAAGRSWVFANWAASGNLGAYFNLGAGTIGTVDSGYSAVIQSVGNGWYRCSVTRLTTAASWYAELDMATADGVFSYTGDGTSGIYLWGAQLAVGPYPLDYTPTTTAVVYGPRFDYDPTTLAPLGLLIEEQRTNLLLQSQDFTTSWTVAGTNATVTSNTTAAPDGTTTADTLTDNATSGVHRVVQSLTTSNTNQMVYSVFAKYSTLQWISISLSTSTGTWAGAKFDVQNGVLGSTSQQGTGFTANSSSITAVGNGWYRCVLVLTPGASGSTVVAISGATDGTTFTTSQRGSEVYSGTSSSVFIWGAQLEAGSFATSYIPTLASAVTRSDDVASVNTLSPWYSSSESTLFAEFDLIGAAAAGSGIAQLSAGSGNGLLFYQNAATLNISAYVDASNVLTGTNVVNVAAKVAIAYNGSSNGAVRNGGTVSSVGTTVSTPGTRLSLGSFYDGTGQMNGHLRRIAYYPRRLTNAEIQALTS